MRGAIPCMGISVNTPYPYRKSWRPRELRTDQLKALSPELTCAGIAGPGPDREGEGGPKLKARELMALSLELAPMWISHIPFACIKGMLAKGRKRLISRSSRL